MGIPIPVFDFKRPIGSIKEYFILLYFDLISSEYYNNGKTVLWSYYQSLYLWSSVGNTVLGSNTIYVPFKLKDKMYKFPLILRPFNNVIKITDDKGNDLSEWAGPYNNFYGIQLTPKDLGCNKVIITYNNGEEDKLIEENEFITGV
uniref:Uncharacterized protein n=1 Tax=viral metagenome TaxID=1070528 RepID=A0A6C0DKR6_9ZZZZ